MNEYLLRGINLALVAIEFFAFIILANSFFRFSRSRFKIAGVCIAAYLFNYGILVFLGQHVIIKLILGCSVFVFMTNYLYSISIARCIFLAVMYLSIINVCDNILLIFISATTHQDITALMAIPYVYYIIAFSAKIFELIIIAAINAWGKRRFYARTSFTWNYVKVLVFPVATLISTIVLLRTYFLYPPAAPQLLLCIIVLLISDIAAIILLNQFEAQQQAILDNRMLQQELKLAHDNIVSLSASYSNERKLTHDFQNKLAVIQGLIQQDQAGTETSKYIQELMNQEYLPSLAVSTHRTVVDVLLNQKYTIAIQKQINFRVQLDDLSDFPLPDDAMVVVLSNLIDNAIEACEKIPDIQSRFILIKAQVSTLESILYIENSVIAPVKISNGLIITTKKDLRQHGYGLPNVLSLIKAHGGTYAMHCEGLNFSFVAYFSNYES